MVQSRSHPTFHSVLSSWTTYSLLSVSILTGSGQLSKLLARSSSALLTLSHVKIPDPSKSPTKSQNVGEQNAQLPPIFSIVESNTGTFSMCGPVTLVEQS